MKAQAAPIREEILRKLSEPTINGKPSLQIIAIDCRFEVDWSIDALGIDPVGRLGLIFFSPKEEETLILTILDAVSWIEKNHALLQERFKLQRMPEKLQARVILVAPEFSAKFLNRLHAMRGIDFTLIESHWVEIAGEKRLRLRRPEASKTLQPKRYPEWALDPQGAAFLREAIEKIAKIDPEIEIEWGPKRVHLLYQGVILALLIPQEQGLQIFVPGEEKLSPAITDHSKLVRCLDSIFRLYIESSAIHENGKAEEKTFELTPMPPRAIRILPGGELLSAEEVEAISK